MDIVKEQSASAYACKLGTSWKSGAAMLPAITIILGERRLWFRRRESA